MEISFAKNGNWKQDLIQAYSFRFTETPDFTQAEDYITTAVNPNHREGFDNISLLSKETYGVGVSATLHFSFINEGCAEIILVPEMETCADGAVRYGACFENIPWKNGINVWRHYREDGRCFWHLRLGLTFSVEENVIHEFTVKVLEKELSITLNGKTAVLHTEDIPEKFHVGITGCEGIARFYDFKIEA